MALCGAEGRGAEALDGDIKSLPEVRRYPKDFQQNPLDALVASSPEKKANVIVFVFVENSRPFSQQLFTIDFYSKVLVKTILYPF